MWAVVPVKGLQESKTRLAPVLDHAQRVGFTLAMVHDVLGQLVQVSSLTGVCVLSDDQNVIRLANQLGIRIWSENADELNFGLQALTKGLSAEGCGAMIIPADVPVARARDYQQLLTGHRDGLTLVAASVDGGTNALLCDAGLNLPFQYGPGSFGLHLQTAREQGIPTTVAQQPRLARDIDQPEDMDWLIRSNQDCRARDYLMGLLPRAVGVKWKKTA